MFDSLKALRFSLEINKRQRPWSWYCAGAVLLFVLAIWLVHIRIQSHKEDELRRQKSLVQASVSSQSKKQIDILKLTPQQESLALVRAQLAQDSLTVLTPISTILTDDVALIEIVVDDAKVKLTIEAKDRAALYDFWHRLNELQDINAPELLEHGKLHRGGLMLETARFQANRIRLQATQLGFPPKEIFHGESTQ